MVVIEVYSTGITYCFWRTYNTRTPAYFVNIPMFCLSFPQRFFILKLHNGGIYYHPLLLIVLISHFIRMWMPLDIL